MTDKIGEAFAASGFSKIDSNTGVVIIPATNQDPPAQRTEEPTAPPAPPTPPAASSTDAAPTTTSIPDITTWLNETFKGEYKSAEDLIKAITDSKSLGTKYSEAEQKLKDFETKSKENPFANDYVKGLNEFVKKGGDPAIYNKVQAIDVPKLNERDALVMRLRVQHGLTKADAEFRVDRKYKVGESFDQADPEVREARIDLKIDGESAKEYLSKYKTDSLVPPGERIQQETERAKAQQLEGWNPVTDKVIEGLKQVEIPIDTKGTTIQFKVPGETVPYLQEHLKNVLATTDLRPDAEGQNIMKEILLREIFFKHSKDIAQQIATAKDEHWIKQTQHPSALREETAGTTTAISDDEKLAEAIAKSQGFKLRK